MILMKKVYQISLIGEIIMRAVSPVKDQGTCGNNLLFFLYIISLISAYFRAVQKKKILVKLLVN
jgi:hypothetical protein